MNKFINLADKLLKNKMWRSQITLIVLSKSKNSEGRVIYSTESSLQCYAVIKDISRIISDNQIIKQTQFYISKKYLGGFDLDNGIFKVQYNGKQYSINRIDRLAILNGSEAVIKMVAVR